MKTLTFSANLVIVFIVIIFQAQFNLTNGHPWEQRGRSSSSDVTAHRDTEHHKSEPKTKLHLRNTGKSESLKLLKRLKEIDRKASQVHRSLLKFKNILTSLRQTQRLSEEHFKDLFDRVLTLRRVLKDAVVSYIDPFKPLTKTPPNGYYLDDVTDVDNAEFELLKILKARDILARRVELILRSARDKMNRVEDIARVFQWILRLSKQTKQVHKSVTALKVLIRENTEEKNVDMSEAQKLREKVMATDDRLMTEIEMPLHHFEPLDKPPLVAYTEEAVETLTNVQKALVSVRHELVQVGDAAVRVLYDSRPDLTQDDSSTRTQNRRSRRWTEMEGTLIQLGDPSLRKLRDSEDKSKQEEEEDKATWMTKAAVGGLLACFAILLGAILAAICYLYKREINRDPYRERKSHNKLLTSSTGEKEEADQTAD